MSGFKDMVAADNAAVFLNLNEFAEKRTIRYDGEEYVDIAVVLSGLKEKDRSQSVSDHAQGSTIERAEKDFSKDFMLRHRSA